jgi:long-chain acyl-CoA synthetase
MLQAQMQAALAGDAAAQAIEFEGVWYHWGDIAKVASAVAQALDDANVAAHGRVGFVPRNRPSAIAAEAGMIAAGRTIRMIYAFQAATGIARDIGRLGLSAVVAAAEDFTPEVMAVLAEQGIAGVALCEMDASLVIGAERSTAPLPDDVGSGPEIQVHTSGTTGAPKHVGFAYDTISKYIVGQNVAAVAQDGANAQPPMLLSYPLGNISGVYMSVPMLVHRRSAILLDRFTLDGWRDYVRRFQPSAPVLPPAAMSMVLDAKVPVSELSCAKAIMSGAAALDPTIQREFEERYGIPVLLSYGATEFGGPVTAMTLELYAEFGDSKRGTVGRPFAGSKLRIVDQDSGDILPAGTEGLLEVVAPRIGDHWIRTTDIAMIDEDGFLYHRGRADGAIVRGGFKLLPETIERALCEHPAVAAATVVGLNDQRLGQVPAAAIVLKSGVSTPSEKELEEHLRHHVYATHIPTQWRIVDDMPRNNSFKIDLPAVKALFANEAAAAS